MALPTNRIRKIKLPDDNTYDIVPEMLGKNSYSAELPTLTGNSTLALQENIKYYELSGGRVTYTGTIPGITELYDGLAIHIYFPVQTNTNCTVNINELGAKAIYLINGGTRVTTHIPAKAYVTLIYNADSDYWVWERAYVDGNSYAYVRQYQFGTNAAGTGTNYPILTRYNLTNKSSSYDTAYTRFYTDTYIDTSNGYLYAPKVYSNGNEVLTGITSSMVTTALGYTPYNSTNPNGYTSNTGTVTSVGAGTGLSISGTSTVNPTVNIDSGYKLPTTTEWAGKQDALPTVTKDRYLHTNASTGALEWSSVSSGPTTYLKSASVSGTFSNTLTISKQDDTLVNFYNYFHSPTYSTGLSIASGRGVNDLYVPEASTTSSGVISTSAQTFVGLKTFKSTALTSYGAVMPNTSSYTANKTLATTDLIVSAEFVEALGYSGNILSSLTVGGNAGPTIYIKFGSTPTSDSDYNAMLSGTSGATVQGNTSYSGEEIAYIWASGSGGNVIYNNQTISLDYQQQAGGITISVFYTRSSPYTLTLTTNGDITLKTAYGGGGGGAD